MSKQPPSAFQSRRRGLAALAVLAVLVAVISGSAAARLFGTDQRPAPVATARPAGQSAATTDASVSAPAPTASGRVSGSPSVPTPPVPTPAPGQQDPAGWSSQQLAAVLVMTGAKMGDAAAIGHAAAAGVGGIVLFSPTSPNLAQTLARAKALAPRGNPPLIASDEEGGQVQRLSSLIYPLPSAEEMGHWSPAKITATARNYALRMKALGVAVALSPDMDIAVPGYYIATTHRGFSDDPQQVAVDANAWNNGLSAAGVLGVIKHWPGHGQASDTHKASSIVPPWSLLQRRDLIPFEAAFAQHASAVLVGHLNVPGLTQGSSPASESTPALRALRAQAGPAVLIMTDDLSMAAASTALGITPAQAAVKSLTAGADIAMVCWTPLDGVLSAVTLAINNGSLPRAQAVTSARRVLHVKDQVTATR